MFRCELCLAPIPGRGSDSRFYVTHEGFLFSHSFHIRCALEHNNSICPNQNCREDLRDLWSHSQSKLVWFFNRYNDPQGIILTSALLLHPLPAPLLFTAGAALLGIKYATQKVFNQTRSISQKEAASQIIETQKNEMLSALTAGVCCAAAAALVPYELYFAGVFAGFAGVCTADCGTSQRESAIQETCLEDRCGTTIAATALCGLLQGVFLKTLFTCSIITGLAAYSRHLALKDNRPA